MTALILKSDPASKDIAIENNNFVLQQGNASLPQKIREKLLLFRNEWFLNSEIGLPFFELIAGQKQIPFPSRKFFVDIIKSVDGVIDVPQINMSIDRKTRTLKVDFIAKISDGNLELSIEV